MRAEMAWRLGGGRQGLKMDALPKDECDDGCGVWGRGEGGGGRGREGRGESGETFRVGTFGHGRAWILSSLFFRRVHLICKLKQTFIIATSPLEPCPREKPPLTSSTVSKHYTLAIARRPSNAQRRISWRPWPGRPKA